MDLSWIILDYLPICAEMLYKNAWNSTSKFGTLEISRPWKVEIIDQIVPANCRTDFLKIYLPESGIHWKKTTKNSFFPVKFQTDYLRRHLWNSYFPAFIFSVQCFKMNWKSIGMHVTQKKIIFFVRKNIFLDKIGSVYKYQRST